MKKYISFVLALVITLLCTACGGYKNPEVTEDQVLIVLPEQEEEVVRNPLTGEPLQNPDTVNSRPVAVMLNNIHYAMPQHGLSDADIIFEYNVESDVTRLIGFFQDVSTVGTIGSVRSARPYFVETVLGMDAIYVHAGGSDEAYIMLYELGIDDLDEIDFSVFWRDEVRAETMAFEHTLMTSGERIAACVEDYGWRTEHAQDFSYPFTYVENGTPYSDTAATDISVRFSDYKTGTFTYDPSTGLYMVGQYDSPHIDGNTGEQLGITNLLILRTDVRNSYDAAGHMIIDVQGSGEGQYICGGKVTDIQWHKEEKDDPFTYTLADGTHFSLGIGKSYVCVVDTDAEVTIS